MKELILIPYSRNKEPCGEKYLEGREIERDLDKEYREKLYVLRKQVAEAFHINLPGGRTSREGYLRPAYQRYIGNIYSKIPHNAWNVLNKNKDLETVIVSALYGIIYWDEYIIDYNVAMSDKISEKEKSI